MNRFLIATIVLLIVAPVQISESAASSEGDKAVYVTTGPFGANLRSYPDNTSSILIIPKGTKLKVIKTEVFKQKSGKVVMQSTWYKVEYKGKPGWVSEFLTEKNEE